MLLPEVALPLAFEAAAVPCAPALLLLDPEWPVLAVPLATLLPSFPFLPLLPPELLPLPPALLLP